MAQSVPVIKVRRHLEALDMIGKEDHQLFDDLIETILDIVTHLELMRLPLTEEEITELTTPAWQQGYDRGFSDAENKYLSHHITGGNQ